METWKTQVLDSLIERDGREKTQIDLIAACKFPPLSPNVNTAVPNHCSVPQTLA